MSVQLVTALPRYEGENLTWIVDWVCVWREAEDAYVVVRSLSTNYDADWLDNVFHTNDLATALNNAFGRNGWGVKVRNHDDFGA